MSEKLREYNEEENPQTSSTETTDKLCELLLIKKSEQFKETYKQIKSERHPDELIEELPQKFDKDQLFDLALCLSQERPRIVSSYFEYFKHPKSKKNFKIAQAIARSDGSVLMEHFEKFGIFDEDSTFQLISIILDKPKKEYMEYLSNETEEAKKKIVEGLQYTTYKKICENLHKANIKNRVYLIDIADKTKQFNKELYERHKDVFSLEENQ